ncbi:MAG: M28 family peptidase [Candidatus Cyclobacteriaceae bacterium M2_1C_046]
MKIKLLLVLLFATFVAFGQEQMISEIKKEVTQEEIELHVRFLASDELMGRETGTRGINVAAAYISSYFKAIGVKHLPGMDSYYQAIPFYRIEAPESGEVKIGQIEAGPGEGFVSNYRKTANLTAPVVFVNYGQEGDLADVNLKDKIAVVMAGTPGGNARSALSATVNNETIQRLEAAGAKAVVFLWHYKEVPWENIKHFINDEKLLRNKPEEETLIPHFFLKATDDEQLEKVKAAIKGNATISYSGREVEEIESYNVLGYIEGADPVAKDKYLLLGAHYDHVGGRESETGEDLIFNGARDNAVGTSAVMMAGDFFSKIKPKHSVILALWTAEEKGLLGSKYFVENPPVALDNIFYNLNIDNAGYNDTTKVTVIGLDRTLAENAIQEATQAFGLEAVTDPSPEQGLFDRSDNVNFARLGIPAPTYSLGFTAFDEEIFKYYHQVTDEAETVNFNYVTKYTRGFVFSAMKIANGQTKTFWMEGDKYEPAGKELYGIE